MIEKPLKNLSIKHLFLPSLKEFINFGGDPLPYHILKDGAVKRYVMERNTLLNIHNISIISNRPEISSLCIVQ